MVNRPELWEYRRIYPFDLVSRRSYMGPIDASSEIGHCAVASPRRKRRFHSPRRYFKLQQPLKQGQFAAAFLRLILWRVPA